jgi:hypothetical protein
MKKLFGILVIAIAIGFAQNANAQGKSATFNLKMNVSNYIEAMASPVNFNFGTTQHTILKAEELCGNVGSWNLAYANCPFSVTISGNNGANQGVPRFARQETGANGGDWDILNTVYDINFTTNGVTTSFAGFFGYLGASDFPKTQNYSEAPHNGQVKMDMKAFVNTATNSLLDHGVSLKRTLIDPNFKNYDSADAGDYKCTMVVTLLAI